MDDNEDARASRHTSARMTTRIEIGGRVSGRRRWTGEEKQGICASTPAALGTELVVNVLGMKDQWQKSAKAEGVYECLDRKTGAVKWTATPVDLIFGSHSELRAIAEVYAAEDGKQKFVNDFARAWNKVMELDRFDLK